MKHKLLGPSGLRVSEICLGAMTFGEDWDFGANKEESRKIFDAFSEAGGNFVDTANCYTNGTSEKFVGEFTCRERERFVVGTKYTISTRRGDVNACGNHRKNLFQSLEASLKRLRTDYIDLYWVHMWDFLTPVEEVMRAIDDAVRAGKILHAGISDTPAWLVSQANTLASLKGWTPFTALQIEYSLIERTPERELLPMAEAFGMAVTPWAPLGAGLLTGKHTEGISSDTKRAESAARRLTARNRAIVQEVIQIAKQANRSPSQVALNWVRQKSSSAIPIVGARTAEQMKENLSCLEFRLGEDDMRRLDLASEIEFGFPFDFLAQERIRDIVFGGTYSSVERPGKRESEHS